MQLQHSKPGTLPSTVRLDLDYLREIVNKLSFPRVFGTPENGKAEELVAEEFRKILASSFVVGETRNVCSGNLEHTRQESISLPVCTLLQPCQIRTTSSIASSRAISANTLRNKRSR